ncbi:MAG: hypothetical protein PSN34_11460 [Urechidicola sp.]|nr:hypothetical protein [Urechidicola sp.]
MAQGDGPRNLLWGPKGATAFIPKWMSLDQNITPGNVLITDTDIDINVFPLTLVHNINIGGKFAQVMLNAVPGNASGIITDTQGVPIPNASASGFADGFIGLKYGLINTPSLNAIEFSQHQQKFSMYFYSRVWYSGTYDEKKPLNLGTNRFTFDFGPVMNLQFSKNSKRPTTLESYLGVHLYTANNSPSIGTFADKSQQLPSLVWENHFSHNFSNKLWGAATLRYQYGGALELDGINQDNKMNILGGGLTLGYQVMPLLAIHTSYGGIITGDNGAQSNMFRVVAMFTYVNLKKLKKQSN